MFWKWHVIPLISLPLGISMSDASPHSPSDLPTLDRSRLDELREIDPPENPETLITLLELFFDTTPALYQQLLDALSNGDTEAIRRHAHKLAGSCGNFGGARATCICRAMDTAADLPAMLALQPSLEQACMEFFGLLRQELDALPRV